MPAAKRSALFHAAFLDDLRFWVETDRTLALRVLDLVGATLRDPFQGIGKPEPLRHQYVGCWSRRISRKHRLVYRVTSSTVEFLQRAQRRGASFDHPIGLEREEEVAPCRHSITLSR